MIAIKTLKLRTRRVRKGKDRILRELMADWKQLVEYFFDICVRYDVKSKAKLHALAYSASKSIVPDKKWHSKYRYTAMEVAVATYKSWTKLKKKRRAEKRPEFKKFFLKLYKESNGIGVYRIFRKDDAWFVRIATTPRNAVVLPLVVSDYEAKFLEVWMKGKIILGEAYLRRLSDGSYELHIAIKKEVEEKDFERRLGVDINERNVTLSVLDGGRVIYAERVGLDGIVELDYTYKMVWIRRLQKKLYSGENPRHLPKWKIKIIQRYAGRWRRRKEHLLHVVAKRIVALATTFQARIVLEDLRDIKSRILNKSRRLNRRLFLADFRKLQFLIEYKARWIGVPVSYVDPRRTSRLCPICGSPMTGLSQRELVCGRCGVVFDRDFAASINIALRDVARGVRAETPMSWVLRRSVSADGCPWEGTTCAMRGRYSSPNITKLGNTYPE